MRESRNPMPAARAGADVAPSFLAPALLPLALLALAGCGGPTEVNLSYAPRGVFPLGPDLRRVRVYVEEVADRRGIRDRIGEDGQVTPAVPAFSVGKPPTEFVRDALRRELGGSGASITDTPDAADRIVRAELTHFFVAEYSLFRAQVRLAVEVADRQGKPLADATGSGESVTYGRTENPANYNATLSGATREAIRRVLADRKFVAALRESERAPDPGPPAR